MADPEKDKDGKTVFKCGDCGRAFQMMTEALLCCEGHGLKEKGPK